MSETGPGKIVAEALRAEGVKAIFGIPGGHILAIYDALYDMPDVKTYLVRHEQTAAAAAAAYAQLTGEPGVCLVTAGPGMTNLLTGVAEAFVGSWPMVLIGGRGSAATVLRGSSQEAPTEKIFAPVVKWSVRVDRADLVGPAIRQAFLIARNGRPGPVLVDIPRDLFMQKTAATPYLPAGPRVKPRPEALAVRQAAQALLKAKNPILIAGGGAVASDAREEIVKLAESLAIPVLTSLSGRGAIGDDHPLSVGGLGAHRNPLSKRLLAEADVVLGLATKFEEMETNWRPGTLPPAEATYIQFDIDPTEIGRSAPAQIGVVGDLKEALIELNGLIALSGLALGAAVLANHPRVRKIMAERARVAEEVDALAASEQRPIHPVRVIRAARETFPKESTVAFDVGAMTQHMAGSSAVFPIYEPRSVISPSSFYGMAFCASALPAAALARPGKPALCFVGDGSFQMALPALPFAAEYKLGVTWIILDDCALGSIRDAQEMVFGNRIIDTDFQFQPDFAALAKACGCYGERVDQPSDVKGACERALAANLKGQPAVLDFRVARERMQQTYDHFTFMKR